MAEKPTREVEEKGLKAYEQARAYERLRTWRLPITYAIPPVGLAALGVEAWVLHRPWLCAVAISLALFVAVRLWLEALKQEIAQEREQPKP